MSDDKEFTLEKVKIHERLVILETKFDAMDEKINIVYKNIVGTNGITGHNTRIDRLEVFKKSSEEGVGRIYFSKTQSWKLDHEVSWN